LQIFGSNFIVLAAKDRLSPRAIVEFSKVGKLGTNPREEDLDRWWPHTARRSMRREKAAHDLEKN